MHKEQNHDEATLLQSFREGEERGFTHLFNQYFPALSIYALNFVNDQESANDIVQEAFINLWKHRERFGKIANIKSYLYRSIHNIAVNWIRKEKKIDENLFRLPALEIFSQTSYDNIVRAELFSEINRLIDILPAGIGAVIRLYYLQEKGIHEISAILKIPLYTVKSRRSRGIEHLRRMLPGYFLLQILFIFLSSAKG